MKKIVIKMRSLKKMVGDDLLKLALMLSLLKVSPVMQHLEPMSDSEENTARPFFFGLGYSTGVGEYLPPPPTSAPKYCSKKHPCTALQSKNPTYCPPTLM